MRKPTIEQLRAMESLRLNVRFMEFLQELRQDYSRETVTQRDEISLRQAQGRAQMADELIDIITRSSEYATKMAESARKAG